MTILRTEQEKQSRAETLFTHEQSDVLKGSAILCVFVCHLGNVFTRLTTPLGGIGVCLFLILSGYGLSVSYEKSRCKSPTGLLAFWRKRLIGVWIPYVLIEIISIPIRDHVSIKSFINDISLIKPEFRLGWYLNYLLLWYILFWCVNKTIEVIDSKHQIHISDKIRIIAWSTISALLALIFIFTSPIRFEQSLSFFAGIVIAYYPSRIRQCIKWRKCYQLFVIAVLVLAFKQTDIARNLQQTGLNIIDLVIKTAASWGIIVFLLLMWKRWKTVFCLVMKPLGKVSYELYLAHGLALCVFKVGINRYLAVGAFIIISAVGTLILYLIDKRTSTWFRKILLR